MVTGRGKLSRAFSPSLENCPGAPNNRWPWAADFSIVALPSCSKTGGEIERLGAGAYRGSRCRLRHSISAVGPKIPYTKKRPLGFHQPTNVIRLD